VRNRNTLSYEATEVLSSREFKVFSLGILAASILIFIRCVYRIAELAGGWANPIMRDETGYIVLDGVWVPFEHLWIVSYWFSVVCAVVLCLCLSSVIQGFGSSRCSSHQLKWRIRAHRSLSRLCLETMAWDYGIVVSEAVRLRKWSGWHVAAYLRNRSIWSRW